VFDVCRKRASSLATDARVGNGPTVYDCRAWADAYLKLLASLAETDTAIMDWIEVNVIRVYPDFDWLRLKLMALGLLLIQILCFHIFFRCLLISPQFPIPHSRSRTRYRDCVGSEGRSRLRCRHSSDQWTVSIFSHPSRLRRIRQASHHVQE
jgi:hypothetical protein